MRCVGAFQNIAGKTDGQDFLRRAQRLALLIEGQRGPKVRGKCLQLLFVIPYVRVDEGDDAQVAHLLDEWLASHPLRAAAHAWVGASGALHRNASGWAFPGVGILMRPL